MKNTSEQILSFAENELIEKESIRSTVLSEASERQKKPFAWAKILLPVAACLVLACGTVLLIPSARAEVARWLRIDSPEQYLTEDPENRMPNEVLDSLIVPPASEVPEETDMPTEPKTDESPAAKPSPLPIGSVTNNKILQVCDEPIWQMIASDFSMELGKSMFDGRNLYLSITMKGLAALPIMDGLTGGNATQFRIPDEMLAEVWENGEVPEEYADGSYTMYEPLQGGFFLQLDDGTEISLGPINPVFSDELSGEIKSIAAKYGYGMLTDAMREQISSDVIEWIPGKELRCTTKLENVHKDGMLAFRNGEYVSVKNVLETLLDYTDENGILSGTVLYVAQEGITGTTHIKLKAEIGTTSFNLSAYKKINGDALKAADPETVLGSQEIVISYDQYVDSADGSDVCTVTNIPTDLAGVTLKIGGDATIDGLGVHGIDLTVTLPDAWTEEQCKGFFDNLWFEAEVEGERFFVPVDSVTKRGDHSVRYTMEVENIPYDRLDRIETVRLIPRLNRKTALLVGDTRTELVPNEMYSAPKTKQNVQWAGESVDLDEGVVVFTRVR